ncbi:MAG TPA: phosphoglycolate phosphatase [Burkholderiales bacterium]|jgi:N-acetyl-D-muramate 6-phosphate phosphatase|nr:phosphoglycolate phosphatase [Burkholderiales bacterium]
MSIKVVLFDLDGTLADTAPDLAAALNALLIEQGRQPISYEDVRPLTSAGARGMLKAGMGIGPSHPDFETLKNRFLTLYENAICVGTRLFDGVPELLKELEARGICWGVVTNKHTRFTTPLIKALELAHRSACIVCGDTTEHSKPHPAPLLHAAELVGATPAECLYVGDDLRDVQAARAAGMQVLAAGYGYLGEENDPVLWKADAIITTPLEILNFLKP